jgi:DNA-directed RNA polymerase specialized sigma24 family protein
MFCAWAQNTIQRAPMVDCWTLLASAVFDDWPGHALARLPSSDLWLVEQLFLRDRTEADIATQIGITQQAVSKRKQLILLRLRRYMTRTSS